MKQVRLKDISSLIMGQSVDNENINDQNIGLEFHQGNSNFYNNYVKKSFIYSVSGKKSINKDILISVRAPVGELSINDRDLYIGRGLAAIRVKPICFYKFIQYFILGNKDLFHNIEKGTTFKSITTFDLKNISIAIPHLQIQTAIANYLDYHTAKIDSEISYLEKKSSLLEEYKQSLIFETVTKGLDKSVPMKDSGIDWIGEIPAHWEVKRVKDVLLLKKEKPLNWKTHKILSLTIRGVIEKNEDNHKGKNPESYDTYQLVSKQDLLLCLFDIDVTPGIVGVSNYIGLASSAYTVAKAININPYYFSYFFYSFHKNKKLMNKVKGLRSSFQKDTFKDLPLYYPPINEQQQISDFLDKETSKIDKQRELMKKKIEFLKEYKQSLIYEAVTGKIDIPQEFYKETI